MHLTKSKVGIDQKGRNKVRLIKMQRAMCETLTIVVEMNQVECV